LVYGILDEFPIPNAKVFYILLIATQEVMGFQEKGSSICCQKQGLKLITCADADQGHRKKVALANNKLGVDFIIVIFTASLSCKKAIAVLDSKRSDLSPILTSPGIAGCA